MWYAVAGMAGLVLGLLIGTQYANKIWRDWMKKELFKEN